jgi:large subunit ribosomal protein L15
MSVKSSPFVPSKYLLDALRPTRRRPTCRCINASQHLPRKAPRSARYVSTGPHQFSEMEVEGEPRSRWSHTPPGMRAPIRAHPEEPSYQNLKINEDPKKLDAMYIRFLGRDGPKMLSEETKWLAVTHKSFDHGRRGFNDRLAFLGWYTASREKIPR